MSHMLLHVCQSMAKENTFSLFVLDYVSSYCCFIELGAIGGIALRHLQLKILGEMGERVYIILMQMLSTVLSLKQNLVLTGY